MYKKNAYKLCKLIQETVEVLLVKLPDNLKHLKSRNPYLHVAQIV